MPTVNQSEAARLLGVSRRTVKRRIEAGELPSPDGVHVVLPDPATPTPAHGHAHPDAHHAPTSEQSPNVGSFPRAWKTGEESAPFSDDLAARLERAESRIDRLLETVHEQNRTIQAQTIRLAQLEGRMLDAAPAQTPAERQEHVIEPDMKGDNLSPYTGRLRAWYMRLRRGR